MAVPDATATLLAEITTPASKGGILDGPGLASFAARIGAAFAADSGGPWRFGSTVLVASHAQVREVLSRDLDFQIAPINAGRIEEVSGAFVLGMDRGAVLVRERGALYRALASVDLTPLRRQVAEQASQRLSSVSQIDIVADYARPVAAQTASALFGIPMTNPALFMEVARAIFGHTFLNLNGNEAVQKRALSAAPIMKAWLEGEIGRRIASGERGTDMMGALLSDPQAPDPDGVRRTLGGLFVGSIDTTATAVAKIVFILGGDKKLADAMAADLDNIGRLRGWCWEALRRWPHNPILLRQAVAVTSLGGVTINPGDRIVLWTQAAMQDASAFPGPQYARPDRPDTAYLHFGDALHACAGRAVNAFQIPLLVGALVRRGIQSVGKVAWAGPFPDHLTVRFSG
jgi:cytochrome P450